MAMFFDTCLRACLWMMEGSVSLCVYLFFPPFSVSIFLRGKKSFYAGFLEH